MLFVVVMSIMMITTVFLITEYYYFKTESQQLMVLKEDYQNYILAFRRLLDECNLIKENQDLLEEPNQEKKKDSFLVVNREFDYLKESALAFSKLHNIEAMVYNLYTVYDFDHEHGQLLLPQTVTKNNKKRTINRATIVRSRAKEQQDLTNYHQKDCNFVWPMDRNSFRIGSRFGPRKKANGQWGFHFGLDLPAPKGTAVKAAAEGVVIEASYSPSGFGKSVVITHNKKYKTRYAHLDIILVSIGQKIQTGECIGRVGATGNVRGIKPFHLHFEVIVFGKKINPLYVLP